MGGVATELWARRRTSPVAGVALALGVGVTGATAWAILERTPSFLPGLGLGIFALSVAAAIVISIPDGLASPSATRSALAVALVAALAGPLAFAADTMATAYGGGDPGAGPQAANAVGGPGGPGGGPDGGPDGPGGGTASNQALVEYLVANRGTARWIVAANGSQESAVLQLEAGLPVMTMGGFSGGSSTPAIVVAQAARAASMSLARHGRRPAARP